MNRTHSPLRLIAALLIAFVLAACERGAEQQAGPAGPVPVTVVTVRPQPVTLTRELSGRTTAYLVAEVRPQVNGIIEQRLFEEGDLVEAGAPLYQLDDDTYRAEHASALANVQAAKAALEAARLTLNRTSRLVESNAVSRQEHDDARAAFLQAQAQLRVAEAAAETTRVVLNYARITAPIAGYIGTSRVTQGALVTANQAEPLTTIQQLDPIYVDLAMSANELLELRKQLAAGDADEAKDVPVTVLLPDGSEYPHKGRLTFTGVTVDPATGRLLLRALVDNPERLLMPGMYVRARVTLAERRDALLAPQRGITRDPKGTAIAMVVNSQGVVEQRQVVTGATVGDQWVVEKGLSAGDRLIVEGLQKIAPGVQVEASEAPAAEAGAGQAR